MALDSDNVRVAVTGAVYVAPTGTTAPTASGSSLDAAFIDLGYVSSDGITEGIDKSTTQIRSWQDGSLVREIVSEGTYSLDMTFIETKEAVLELYYGSAITTGELGLNPRATGDASRSLLTLLTAVLLSVFTFRRQRSPLLASVLLPLVKRLVTT